MSMLARLVGNVAPALLGVALLGGACQPAADPPAGPGAGAGSGGAGGGRASGGGSGAGQASGGAAGAPSGTGGTGGGGAGGSPAATGGTAGAANEPAADAATGSDGVSSSDASSSAPGARTSPACGQGRPVPAEGYHTLKVGNLDRRFFLRLPASYDGKTAQPVIFALHGAGNKDGNWFDTNTGVRKANEDRAVLVFGESLYRPGSMTRSWQDESQLPANLAYVDATIDWLKQQLCIDPGRIFAAGQSSGAYFGQTLACQRGDVFRAVATSDGGERYFRDCKGNPGVFVRWRPAGANAADNRRALDFWVKHNGCGASASEATPVPPCMAHPGCREGAPLWSCSDGQAHDWPGYMDAGIWTFFATFK